jgi:hypothetical protein
MTLEINLSLPSQVVSDKQRASCRLALPSIRPDLAIFKEGTGEAAFLKNEGKRP